MSMPPPLMLKSTMPPSDVEKYNATQLMSKSTMPPSANVEKYNATQLTHAAGLNRASCYCRQLRSPCRRRFSPTILNFDGETASELFADGVGVGPGTRQPARSSRHSALGSRHSASGTGHSARGARHSAHGALGTRAPGRGTGRLAPGARPPVPGARHPAPGPWPLAPGTPAPRKSRPGLASGQPRGHCRACWLGARNNREMPGRARREKSYAKRIGKRAEV